MEKRLHMATAEEINTAWLLQASSFQLQAKSLPASSYSCVKLR